MDKKIQKSLTKLRDNLPFFSERLLNIVTKDGTIEKLHLNKAQSYIHGKLEDQRNSMGRVRALILKGRQQGCSTYVGARFYHKVIHNFGVNAFILTHLAEATDNLFRMTKRYHDNVPEGMAPTSDVSNARQLYFEGLQSGYKVGTAKSGSTGRSSTVHYFHGSEVAFWDRADEIAAGVMQAISKADGTEVILESTANGMGNYFHELWQSAEKGQGEYQAIFVPWFWQDEYRLPVEEKIIKTEDELQYQNNFGIDDEQLLWMRSKLVEFKGDWALFNQEYPATSALAFQFSDTESFVPSKHVLRARKEEMNNSFGPLLLGVDPAWSVKSDRTSIIRRRGKKAWDLQYIQTDDTMHLCGMIAKIIKEENIDKCFIDVGGAGTAIVQMLHELGYKHKVMAVNFGWEAMDKSRFQNKRAEMWGLMRDWLIEWPVRIPDSDSLQADICGPGYKYDSSTRLLLEKKEDMRKRGVRSPDGADALALTFAFPVTEELNSSKIIRSTGKNELKTSRKRRR